MKKTALAKFISGLLIIESLIAGSLLTGCGNFSALTGHNTVKDVTKLPTESVTLEADSDNVKIIGRTIYENDSLWMVMSGSGCEFKFYGTQATININGDNTSLKMGGNKDAQPRMQFYVNDELVLDEMVDELSKSYDVVKADEPSWYTIKVIKVSEAEQSTAGIESIAVTAAGGIFPTDDKDLKIEFIGDSITCAYGVDDENKLNHFSTKTEDATKGYAIQTAQLLDADYSLFSFSGFGVLSGYIGGTSNTPNTEQTVPLYYDKLGFSYSAYRGQTPSDYEWDFNTFTPDIIVLNLGTNDSSYTKGDGERIEAFTEKYVEFLELIRQKNPNAKIICTLGIMGADLYPAIEDAVNKYCDKNSDKEIYTYKFPIQDEADGIAADWHPTYTTHKKDANLLAEFIKSIQ